MLIRNLQFLAIPLVLAVFILETRANYHSHHRSTDLARRRKYQRLLDRLTTVSESHPRQENQSHLKAERFDYVEDWASETRRYRKANISEGVRKKPHGGSVESASAPTIWIDFKCELPKEDEDQCANALKAYHRAARFISSALVLKRTITVRAEYYSYCEKLQECGSKTLGNANSMSHWKIPGVEGLSDQVWYPQALAKQLSPFEMDWGKYDIKAVFNAEKLQGGKNRFWFPEDGKRIHRKQYDFEYVALHELIHGLGFLSSWSTYLDDKEPGVISPMYYIKNSEQNKSVAGVAPPFIFDQFIYTTKENTPMIDSYDKMNDPSLFTDNSFSTFLTNFKASPAYEEGKKLYNLATTPGALDFRCPPTIKSGNKKIQKYQDTLILPLETNYEKFKAGSSLSHFDHKTFTKSQDFLMRAEADPGRTLQEITPKDAFPIGPYTLRVLETMGYEVTSDPLEKYGTGNFARINSPVMWIIISCLVVSSTI